MENEVKQYYKNIEIINTIKDVITQNRAVFEDAIKEDIAKLEMFEKENEELRKKISSEAKIKFIETGEKKLDFGIGIRVSTKFDYPEDKAIEWAKENMPVAIKQAIDRKQFEGYAKDNELDFVTKEEQITVTFPKEIK